MSKPEPRAITLTSSDPQPGWGVIVRDVDGREWENTGGEEGSWANWQQTDATQPDPETWIKVAGNYGPVTLVYPTSLPLFDA